jgi:hypothetical protein
MAIEIPLRAEVELGEGAKSLKQLKQEFKETQKELDGLQQGSERYVQTLKKLGKIKDDISDLNTEIKAFNPEGKVQALSSVIGGVASGFQAATGAAALFGSESGEVQKALLKVQAAMAFTEGIKGIVGLQDGFKVLWNIIKANPLSAVFAGLTAIAGVVAAIYTNMDRTSTATKELNKQLEKQKEITESLKRETQRQVELLTAQGASEKEIIETKKKLAEAQLLEIAISIKQHISKVRDIQDNDSITESIYNTQAAIYRKLGASQAAESFEKMAQASKVERAKEDLDAIKKESEDLKDLQNQIKVFAAQEVQIDKKKNEELAKQREESLKDQNKALEQALRDGQAIRSVIAEEERQAALQKELEQQALEDRETQRILDAQVARLESERIYNEASFAGQLANLELKKQAELNNTELTESEKLLIKQKYADEEGKLKSQQFQQELEGYQQLVLATKAITDIAFNYQLKQAQGNAKKEQEIRKKQFRVNKAFGIANSIIDGVQAVQKALNNPYPLNLILAIASGILATANTVKIAATKFDDGGGSSSAPSLNANIPDIGNAPAVNAPQNSSTLLNPDGTVQNNKLPPQPIVIKNNISETEITAKQRGVSDIEERATIK